MKKLLVLLLVLASSAAAASAQKTRSLEYFQRDTVEYVKYNFYDRKNEYIGKPLSELLDSYDIDFRVGPANTWEGAPEANGISWIEGATIRTYKQSPGRQKTWATIIVHFKEYYPISYTELSKTVDHYDSEKWKELLKDYTIGDIVINMSPQDTEKSNSSGQ